jgi:hypothetical protein
MFTVRTLRLAGGPPAIETAQFDLEPRLAPGRTVCNLFAEFLSNRPGEFREQLPFLNKSGFELDWAAASGGAAFASFFHEGQPLGMAALISGAGSESDAQMLAAMRLSILEPLGAGDAEIPDRPGVLLVDLTSGRPEHGPTLQLLVTALASVYFRAVLAMSAPPL